MIVSMLLCLLGAATAQGPPSVNFVMGCGRYSGPCENKCYAVYRANKPATTTWDRPDGPTKRARRIAAGTANNPCCGTITAPAVCHDPNGAVVPCTSPDEYPYAASAEGGQATGSAIIRCTGVQENLEEGRVDYQGLLTLSAADGGCGGRAGCMVTLGFSFIDPNLSQNAQNDGHTYAYNGAYILAKRDGELVQEPVYEVHRPDPRDFFPLHLRRELLLDNGVRVLVGSRDLEKSWEGEIWIIGNSTARVVRELHGDEKSEPFRPLNSTLQTV